MFCSKIGADCPHTVSKDNNYFFVMMPFKDFKSIYDAIQTAVQAIPGKTFVCERADDKFTNVAIWCNRICKNIRKANYLIVDTTGKNPNVFYELGFAHALDKTRAIIITQNLDDAPFDIRELNHIEYSVTDLPRLREDLRKAIVALENEELDTSYVSQSSDFVINDLKVQLREEEGRASRFKNELMESEDKERKLKKYIDELESIQKNPVNEAQNTITELEGTIAELKSKLKFLEKGNENKISLLQQALQEKEKVLKDLEEKYSQYKSSSDAGPLTNFMMNNSKIRSQAIKWFEKAYDESQYEKKIEYYSMAIKLDPKYINPYINRGIAYDNLEQFEKAVSDYNKAIELDPNRATAYINRGIAYTNLEQFEKAVSDYNKAIELDPNRAAAYINRGIAYSNHKEFEKAVSDYNKAIELDPNVALAYSNRGIAYSNLKQFEKAVADYNKAIELDPKKAGYYINLAEILIITGDYKKALGLLQQSLVLKPAIGDQVIAIHLECIAKCLLDIDVRDCIAKLNEQIKKEFTFSWSFNEVESWLERATISEDKKKFIITIIEMIKK